MDGMVCRVRINRDPRLAVYRDSPSFDEAETRLVRKNHRNKCGTEHPVAAGRVRALKQTLCVWLEFGQFFQGAFGNLTDEDARPPRASPPALTARCASV